MPKSLREQLDEISPRPQTRDEVVEWFQKHYTGVKYDKRGKATYEWKSKLVDALEPVTGLSKKSLQRRFQDRGSKRWQDIQPSKEHREQYKELGSMLEPDPPAGGYTVTGAVWILFSSTCEKRTLPAPIHLTGEDAREFLRTADEQIIIDAYMGDEGYSSCAEPELEIE